MRFATANFTCFLILPLKPALPPGPSYQLFRLWRRLTEILPGFLISWTIIVDMRSRFSSSPNSSAVYYIQFNNKLINGGSAGTHGLLHCSNPDRLATPPKRQISESVRQSLLFGHFPMGNARVKTLPLLGKAQFVFGKTGQRSALLPRPPVWLQENLRPIRVDSFIHLMPLWINLIRGSTMW